MGWKHLLIVRRLLRHAYELCNFLGNISVKKGLKFNILYQNEGFEL